MARDEMRNAVAHACDITRREGNERGSDGEDVSEVL